MLRPSRLGEILRTKRFLIFKLLSFATLSFLVLHLVSSNDGQTSKTYFTNYLHKSAVIRIKWYHSDNVSSLHNQDVTDLPNADQPIQNQSSLVLIPSCSFTGSEDLSYPLNIDMLDLIHRLSTKQTVSETPINHLGFEYTISNSDKCTRLQASASEVPGTRPSLLILIKSAPENLQRRDAIRISWGAENCYGGRHVVRLFLLGQPSSNETRLRLASEAAHYGDIIQQNFTDHYFNNTYKLMMGIDWAVRFCSETPMVMFVDDDYFVYPRNVIAFLESLSPSMLTRFVGGYLWRNSSPVRRKRGSLADKWAIDRAEYPHNSYPPYLAAGNFFLSMSVAFEVNMAMRYTRYLRFDDVFLGIVLNKLLLIPVHLSHVYSFVAANNITGVGKMLSSHYYASTTAKLDLWKKLNCQSFCVQSVKKK